jgi:hypothetical protein
LCLGAFVAILSGLSGLGVIGHRPSLKREEQNRIFERFQELMNEFSFILWIGTIPPFLSQTLLGVPGYPNPVLKRT